jgi:hypothetical protein
LLNASDVDPFPANTIVRDDFVAWPTNIGDAVAADIGTDELSKIKDRVRAKHGIDVPNMEKNLLFIGFVMTQAWEEGKISPTLEKLCQHVVGFAKRSGGPVQAPIPL